MARSPSARALGLIESLYEAVAEPLAWNGFARALSAEFGDAAVALSLALPGRQAPRETYRVHLDERFGFTFARYLAKGLPWGALEQPAFVHRFAQGREFFPDADLAATPFYQEWMRPQGLAAEGPCAHSFGVAEGRVVAAVAIYRREGCRPFRDADVATADLLVPHLARCWQLHRSFRRSQRRRDALAEVIDRLPAGVLLLDSTGEVVATNRSAERIARQGDGFSIVDGRPRALDPDDDTALQAFLADALAPGDDSHLGEHALTLRRPSRRRDFTVLLSGLAAGREPGPLDEATAVLFVADPEEPHTGVAELLVSLYDLTPAEADLARLLVEGEGLDSAAAIQGVGTRQVRSELRRIYEKTGVRTPTDLVRLVLGSAAALEDARRV